MYPLTEQQRQQMEYENETWRRLLEFLQAENVFLKTRLARIANASIAPELLEQIEYFQNQFIGEDNSLALLRYDVARLRQDSDHHNTDGAALLHHRKKLRKDIELAEQTFSKLKFEFNNYFAEYL
jgi:hypothetical protein